MKDKDKSILEHILKYCSDIDKTIQRFGNDYLVFEKDTDYYNSVNMSLLQIGELAGRLSDEFKNELGNNIQWGLIRGMRNILAHTYSSAAPEIIWEAASKDVPKLADFCKKRLDFQVNLTVGNTNYSDLLDTLQADASDSNNIEKNDIDINSNLGD